MPNIINMIEEKGLDNKDVMNLIEENMSKYHSETITDGYLSQMINYLKYYSKFFPVHTFPWVILASAAILQNMAWFSSHIFKADINLVNRVLFSWMIAFFEYIFLIPGLNISSHILNLSHVKTIVMLHSFQLIAYVTFNKIFVKEQLTYKKYLSLLLIVVAIVLVNGD
jgi:uncharacterized protein (DUF486 family)